MNCASSDCESLNSVCELPQPVVKTVNMDVITVLLSNLSLLDFNFKSNSISEKADDLTRLRMFAQELHQNSSLQ